MLSIQKHALRPLFHHFQKLLWSLRLLLQLLSLLSCEKPELSTLINQRFDFYPLIALVFWFRTLITAWDCLNSLHFRLSLFFPCSSVFLGFFFECGVFLVELRHHLLLNLRFLHFFSCFFSFLQDGPNKNHTQSSSQCSFQRSSPPWLQSPVPLGLRRASCWDLLSHLY